MTAWAIACALATVAAFHLATLREGHRWVGDFSQYFAHARNLVEGQPYDQTGYLRSESFLLLAPETYPPGYPVLLAPIYALTGIDLLAAKALGVILLTLGLAVLARVMRSLLSPGYLVALILCVGLSPFYWLHKDEVGSDLAFVPTAYLALASMQRAYATGAWRDDALRRGVAVGLLMYCGYAVRTVGAVLPLTLLVYDTCRHGRPSRFALIALATAALAASPQLVFLHPGDSYLDQFRLNEWAVIQHNLGTLRALWSNGYDDGLRDGLHWIMLSLSVLGLGVRMRRGATVFEAFAPLYLGCVVAWSIYHERYLIPVAPLAVAYALIGLQTLQAWRPVQRLRLDLALPALAFCGITATYVAAYTSFRYGPIHGVDHPQTSALFAFVRQHTSPADTIIFRFPRILALYTDRNVGAWRPDEAPLETLAFLDRVEARYLVVSNMPYGDDRRANRRLRDRREWARVFGHARGRFENVFNNHHFGVYRIRPRGAGR